MIWRALAIVFLCASSAYGQLGTLGGSRYDPDSLSNPYGAGSPYKLDGLMNPYSKYGSRYSPYSWRNPYATSPPKIYSRRGYVGELTVNPYRQRATLRTRYRRLYIRPGK